MLLVQITTPHVLAMHAGMGDRSRSFAAMQSKIDSLRREAQQRAVNTFRATKNKSLTAAVSNVCLRTLNRWIAKADRGEPMGHLSKPGRPRKLTAADLAVLRQAGAKRETGTSSKAAAALQAIRGTVISKSTAWRALTSNKHAFRVYRRVPMLSAAQKAKRRAFSHAWRNLDWNRVMFTDSKYFTADSSSRRVGHYRPVAAPPETVGKPKNQASWHVYMGVTAFGVTKMVFVTGGSKRNTACFRHDGKLCRGVCSREYRKDVLPVFKSEGARLFSQHNRRSWFLQQDGARIHQTKDSIAQAEQCAPAGLLQPWPPSSPDLSPIENVWAMMAADMAHLPVTKTKNDLRCQLEQVAAGLTAERVAPLFDSMKRRLKDCLLLGGEIVRF